MNTWSLPEPPKDVKEFMKEHPEGPIKARIGSNEVSIFVIPEHRVTLQDWEMEAINEGVADQEAGRVKPFDTDSFLVGMHRKHTQRE